VLGGGAQKPVGGAVAIGRRHRKPLVTCLM
jgi:hypothetical protein